MGSSEWSVVLDAHAILGEGPVWVDGQLWWVDIERGWIHRTEPGSMIDTVHEVGEPVGSVCPRRGGGFIVGMSDGVALFGPAGTEERRVAIEASDTASRMNDAKSDPAGRLFTGTMTKQDRRSALYRVDTDCSVTTIFGGVGISNGLGWSPDASRMYYIDTPTMRVDVFDFDNSDGSVDHRRTLVEIGDGCGYPDGMTVDAEGCLWVAFWDGWCVRRYDVEGNLLRTVDLPVARITSCAFGGPDLDRLFVTSATDGLQPQQRADQPLAGSLFEIDPGCRGLPVTLFAG